MALLPRFFRAPGDTRLGANWCQFQRMVTRRAMESPKVKSVIAHVRQFDGAVQTLEAHLHEVGAIAAENTAKIGLPDAGRLLGLLHDFGKYSQQFQAYIRSATGDMDRDDEDYVDASSLKGKIDHSTAGAQYIWNAFKKIGGRGQGELTGQMMSLCIASHHSGLIDCIDKMVLPLKSRHSN